MLKKVITLVLSLSFLVACGGQNTENKVLKLGIAEEYVEYVEHIAEGFTEETGFEVEIIEKDLFDQLEGLPLDGPSGNAADIMIAPNDRVGQLASQGHVKTLDIDLSSYFSDEVLQGVDIEGEIVGAPAVIESLILFYNKKLLKDSPKTFEDLEKISKDDRFNFETESGKNTGFLAKWTDFYVAYGLISGYGGYVFGDDGFDPNDLGLDNDGAIDGISYATHWFQEVWPQGMLDTASSGDLLTNLFIEGKAAAVIDGPWNTETYLNAGIDLGAVQIPTLPNGKPYKSFAGGKSWLISQYTENTEAAEAWIEYVVQDQQQKKMYEMTGQIPANKKAHEIIMESNDEIAKAIISQHSTSNPMPIIPEMGEVWEGAENMMFDAGSGAKTPEAAAKDSSNWIRQQIKEKHQD